jgi:hypothetical protein
MPETDEASDERRAAAARQRFWFIGIFRLSGVFILIFGLAISLQNFSWVQGDKAKYLGMIVSTVGMFQTIFIPRMLARAWATPRERT